MPHAGAPRSHPFRLGVTGAISLCVTATFGLAWGQAWVSVFPKAGAKLACPDPALRFHFDATPKLGSQGRLRVVQASTRAEVFSLDFKTLRDYGETGNLNDPVPSASRLNTWPWKDTLISREFRLHPLAVVGREAVVDLRRARLKPSTEYEVIADVGLFSNGGTSAAVANGEWRFTTGNPSDPSAAEWSIDAAGNGNFCTVQGALDALPARSGKAVTLRLRAGVYPELVRVKSPGAITLVGAGQDRSRIVYRNSDTFNAGTRLRASFGIESNQVRLFDVFIENATPKGGTQAEALAYWGDKLVLGRVHLKSFQDTYMGNGRAFIYDSFIEGDVDYLWGSGPAFVYKTRLRSLNAGYVVQARNEQGQRGFVFDQCDLTTASGVSGAFLGRNAGDQYFYAEIVYNQCTMDGGFSPAGWKYDPGDVSHVLFAEYQSKTPQGGTLDISKRQAPARQLTSAEAQNFARVAYVLGGTDNWKPDTTGVPSVAVAPKRVGEPQASPLKPTGTGIHSSGLGQVFGPGFWIGRTRINPGSEIESGKRRLKMRP